MGGFQSMFRIEFINCNIQQLHILFQVKNGDFEFVLVIVTCPGHRVSS